MNSKLHEQCCRAPDSAAAPLTPAQADELLAQLGSQWQRDEQARSLRRTFDFADYRETLAFVNAVAWIAERQDHHPDLLVRYRDCTVTFTTHCVGGLSINDFICAARVGRLLDE
ncbi:4a-hydroxytetrahydrobiopterin dehydratase [Granulosicoccaceae sp. 1_MG-2023]|nr:4a-hydroxytetrahydrobiopterin dehydratase [Granulosicoccaceae sp. 1_MG-2023]